MESVLHCVACQDVPRPSTDPRTLLFVMPSLATTPRRRTDELIPCVSAARRQRGDGPLDQEGWKQQEKKVM
ncbi:hypothetical protein E2C01_002061 [Portunus trituberculatus]|uniref:Uncharacterized protein n=1 Tax=Portunus trituberculatus TaxID=210409 RepID=A0A5B7CIW4_PORTR|nr:hypothetical protein [Portunus trituberculatus]